MNKKIKVIELLNKIANDESYRPTVKYQEMTYTYLWDIGDYTNDFNSEYGIFSGWALNLMLNDEVEILEDNIEKIEIIKMTDFLNMVTQGLIEDKTRIRIYSIGDESGIPYICEYDKSNTGKIWCISSYDTKFELKIDYMKILNYYVEILKDNIQ